MAFEAKQKTDKILAATNLKLALANGANLDEHGLLFIILHRHLSFDNAKRVAHRLLHKFNKLAAILNADMHELVAVKGISNGVALELIHLRQLLNALLRTHLSQGPIIHCYDTLIEFCASKLGHLQKEQFHGFFLNKRFELLHHECLQTGTLDHVTVYPRELLRLALQHSASFIILAHNHPFGKALPSQGDIQMTRQLAQLAEGLGIFILDHLILADGESYSFLKNHQINASSPAMKHFVSQKPLN